MEEEEVVTAVELATATGLLYLPQASQPSVAQPSVAKGLNRPMSPKLNSFVT